MFEVKGWARNKRERTKVSFFSMIQEGYNISRVNS
jgi:hypothetical protein